jgi:bifunctional UDP-N-acetylglucosamine pyrophosphorylase/glucosamine-1-phosphate N-acetyltransferase
MSLEVIILAAGKGSRMYSNIPKVLHKIAGKPLISHIIDNAMKLSPEKIHVVYGYGGELVPQTLGNKYNYVLQKELLGTAHAVQQALPYCKDNSNILILVSDIPLITSDVMSLIVKAINNTGIAVLTAIVENPTGLGRIIRDEKGFVQSIIEDKDCNNEQKKITEINTGVIAGDKKSLESLIKLVKNENNQKEYYLTDIISLANQNNINVFGIQAPSYKECEGINNKVQLAMTERYYQEKLATSYMEKGLIITDPKRVDFRGELIFGKNVVLDVNVIIEGKVVLGDNVVIGPGCILKDCVIGDNSVISAYTIIESTQVGKNATLGPFARFRPGCELADDVHVGNFVEVKKTKLGKGSKAGHLTYLGDSDIGKNVNIGAGTITCNYDGANKHKTVIGDNVFVGSDSQLVAPVSVGSGATIGAGTTVTKNINTDSLAITRTPLRQIPNWSRPTKDK